MRRAIPIIFWLAAWLARPTPAWACGCPEPDDPPAAAAYAHADAVFLGTVTGVADYRKFPLFDTLMDVWPQQAARFYDVRTSFSVIDSWKGVSTLAVTVRTGRICGFIFTPGEQYVVYAYEVHGSLKTNFCTRTTDAGEAEYDFRYLNGLPALSLTPARPSPVTLGCLGLSAGAGLLAAAVAWRATRRPPKPAAL